MIVGDIDSFVCEDLKHFLPLKAYCSIPEDAFIEGDEYIVG